MRKREKFFYHHHVWIILVSSISFLCYMNTLKAEFAYDDNRAILENSDILPQTPWQNILQNDFWGTPLSHSGSHKSYRPLTVLSFRLNYVIGQMDPMGYHLVNVILHCIMTGLFYSLAHSMLGSTLQAIFASLLFAVHPIHTEAVSGVVGRADILSCIFFTLSLFSYKNAVNLDAMRCRTNWKYLLLSLVSSLAAMLSKEIGITVLAVCVIYDVIFVTELTLWNFKASLERAKERGTLSRVFCLILASIMAIYWRLVIMDLKTPNFNVSDNPASSHTQFKVRLLTFSYLPVLNFYLLLFPWELSFDWSMDAVQLITSANDRRNLETVIFYSSLIAVCMKYAWRIPREFADDSSESGSCTDFESSSSNGNEMEDFHSTHSSGPKSFLPLSGFKFNCMMSNDRRAHVYTSKQNELSNGNQKPSKECFVKNRHPKSSNNGSKKGLNVRNANCRTVMNGYFANEKMTSNDIKENQREGNYFNVKFNGVAELFENSESFNQNLDVAIFSVALMVLSFIPATNLFFYVGFVIAERVLYIPSIGICLLVSVGLGRIWNSYDKLRPTLVLLYVIFLGFFAARTINRNEDWKNEESLYRSGLHINPAKAWGNLGGVLSQQGKLQGAEEAYRTALKFKPNMADAHYNLGILLQNMKRYNESIKCYNNAIHYRPQLASAYLNLGLVYDQMGYKNEALQVLQSARSLSDHGLKNPKAHRYSSSIRYNIGKILFDFGRYKEAIANFQDAIEIMPDSYAPHSLYNMLGQSHSFLGATKHAEYWYLKSLKSNATHVPAHLTYARHLLAVGNLQKAENWFLRAIKLQPNNSESYFHYANFLHKTHRLDEALVQIENSIELNPNEINTILFAASCYREAKIYSKAEVYYRRAVELNPDDSGHHMNLGAILHLTGRLEGAKVSYKEALRLNPRDELTIANLRKLESMQLRTQSMK